MGTMEMSWLIEEVTTGLVDGYWASENSAIQFKKWFEKEYPNLKFIVKYDENPHYLQDCELLNKADWFWK